MAGPQTAGAVLHHARLYDLFGSLMSSGRSRAIRQKLVELAAPSSGEKILDVGCGPGTLALAFKAAVPTSELHGIDASPEMIEIARQNAANAGSVVDFQLALIEALPFSDGTLDLVTSSLMLHHLPDALKRAGLLEIRRVLRPGGRFVAVDFAAESHSILGAGRALGHLLSILGHSHGESTAASCCRCSMKPVSITSRNVPTTHKNFAFIRAT